MVTIGWCDSRGHASLRRFCLLATVLFLGMRSTVLHASETSDCSPVVSDGSAVVELDKSGLYCLNADLLWEQTGPAIRISGSNITLDLKKNIIQGNEDVPNQIGILVEEKSDDIWIKNGSVDSLEVGIRAQNVQKLSLESLDFVNISWFGAHVSGNENRVLDSRFSEIGYRDDGENDEAYAIGILGGGKSMLVENNIFNNVNRQPVDVNWVGEGVSILLSEGSDGFKILNNFFSTTLEKSPDTIGLWARTKNIVIKNNRFKNIYRPIEGAYEGATRLTGNEFEFEKIDASKKEIIGARRKRGAVAMKISGSDKTVISENKFSGFTCPVLISSTVAVNLNLESKNNKAIWSNGRRFCNSGGVWHSNVINWPEPPKNRKSRP